MAEHVILNNQTRVATKVLYAKYLEWVKEEGVEVPAKANKFGVAVARLFENPEVRQYDTPEAKKQYFYEGLHLITSDIRQDFCQRFSFPEHVTAETQSSVLKLHYATVVFLDHEMFEYTVAYNMTNVKYMITVRGVELDNEKMGLTSFADLDQVFVDGLNTIFAAMYFCQGLAIKIKPKYKKSKIPEQHILGFLGGSGQEEKCMKRWYSRNCKAVLNLTQELGNYTCSKCVHDLARYKVADGLKMEVTAPEDEITPAKGNSSNDHEKSDENSDDSDTSTDEETTKDNSDEVCTLFKSYWLSVTQ